MASFVWLLLTKPTYNQTHLAALAWRARILGQKALGNVSRFSSGVGAFCPRMTTFYFKEASTQSNGGVGPLWKDASGRKFALKRLQSAGPASRTLFA